MICPNCNLINPQGADHCDCGYDFLTGRMRAVQTEIGANPPADEPERSIWSFQGRIGRGSFWARFLSLLALNLMAGFLMGAIASSGEGAWPLVLLIYVATVVVGVWLGLAMQVTRWHDLDRSGWMVLLNFTFIAIPIVLIILGCVRGTEGPNKYGSDPVTTRPVRSMSASFSQTVCDDCREVFPSPFYLEKSSDGRYLCEKCREKAQSVGTA